MNVVENDTPETGRAPPVGEIAPHPLANIFPMLRGEAFDELRADIRDNGLAEPIWLLDGMVLDGRNRLAACLAEGVDYETREFTGDDPLEFVISLNLHRRHLDSGQRACVAVDLERAFAERARERKAAAAARSNRSRAASVDAPEMATDESLEERPVPQFFAEPGEAREQAAKAVGGTNRQYVSDAKKLERENPELFDKVKSGEVAISKARKQLRRQELETQRSERAEQAAAVVHTDDMIDLRCADARSLLDAEPMALDWIVTDPPYPREFLPCFDLLAEIGERHLRDGGGLLCMSGQMYLPDVYAALSKRLDYWWTVAYQTPGGQATQLFPRKVNTFWKPILWYGKGEYTGDWIGDVTKSDVNDNDKTRHHWGQSESGMHDLMRRFVRPGQTVLDPFMGAGTTGIVARQLGARFVGVEVDEAHYNEAKVRHADV